MLSYVFHVFATNDKLSIQQLTELFKIEQKQVSSLKVSCRSGDGCVFIELDK